MDPFPFNHPSGQSTNNGNGNGMMEDLDLDALLAQLTGGQPDHNLVGNGNADGLGAGINLEDLFATVDNAAATDDALAEDMMKFLAGLENDTDQQFGGTGQEQQQQQQQQQ